MIPSDKLQNKPANKSPYGRLPSANQLSSSVFLLFDIILQSKGQPVNSPFSPLPPKVNNSNSNSGGNSNKESENDSRG